MSRLVAFGYLVATIAAALAWSVSRSRPSHRPVAAILTFAIVADVARRALRVLVLAPAYATLNGEPARGLVRVTAHVDQALFLAYPAALAALIAWVYTAKRPWLVLLGSALADVAFIASYPAVRGEPIRKLYLGFQLACLTVAVASVLHWMMFRKDPPTASHLVVGLLMVAEVVNVIAGPWRLGFDKWDLAQLVYGMLYVMLILIHWGWLWTIKNSSAR